MTRTATKSAVKRVRTYAHKVEGDYWSDFLKKAQDAHRQYRQHVNRLHHLSLPREVAQELVGINFHVEEMADQVRELAQIGATNG
jgi:hypothetical protein